MSERYQKYVTRTTNHKVTWVGKTKSGHTRVLVPGAAINVKKGTIGIGQVKVGEPLPEALAKALSYGGNSQFFVGFPRPAKSQAVEPATEPAAATN
jgi:hypothetical protein